MRITVVIPFNEKVKGQVARQALNLVCYLHLQLFILATSCFEFATTNANGSRQQQSVYHVRLLQAISKRWSTFCIPKMDIGTQT